MGAKNSWNETKQQARYEVLFGPDERDIHDAVIAATRRLGYRSVAAYLITLAKAVHMAEQGDATLLPILGLFHPLPPPTARVPSSPPRDETFRPADLAALDRLLDEAL